MSRTRGARAFTALLPLLLFGAAGCAKTTTERLGLPEPRTVEHVDLERYMGTWYEIASFPQRFQEGCTGSTANYTLREDGEVDVVNRCFKGSLDGEEDVAEGRARVVDPKQPGKLEVTFFWPFQGDYWILEIGPEYEYAVVGHPSRDYLWILSRTPHMPEAVYANILRRSREQRFDVERLQKTLQPSHARE